MSLLSVQLKSLGLGSESLKAQELYPPHQKRLESVLSNLFSKAAPSITPQNNSFSLELTPDGASLTLAGRQIALGAQDLQEVKRVLDYYKHTGQLGKNSRASSQVGRSLEKSVKAMNDASIPGTNGKIISGMHITEDTISLIRNAVYAISPAGIADPIGEQLGYYTGLLGAFFAFREIDEGRTELKRANEVGDNEGSRRAKARLLRASIVSSAATTHLVGKFLSPVLSATAASCISVATDTLFGLGAVLSLGISTLGAVRCYRFNARLNEYIDNPKLDIEQRLRASLQFLKDQMSVNEEEEKAIEKKIEKEHPNSTPEEKKKLVEKEIANRIEVKVKYLKRRTSNKSISLILKQVDSILAKLSSPATSVEGIHEATVLLSKIQKENKTKLVLYALTIVASLLGLLGMLLFVLCPPLAALPFVIYGIAGMIYLGTTLYTARDVFKKRAISCDYNMALDMQSPRR